MGWLVEKEKLFRISIDNRQPKGLVPDIHTPSPPKLNFNNISQSITKADDAFFFKIKFRRTKT